MRSGTDITVQSVPCGGDPDINNTGAIDVDGVGGTQAFTIDMSGGQFTVGGNEIDIDVDLGDGNDTLVVRGGSSAETIIAGVNGINLNNDGNEDVTLANTEVVTLEGGGGDDTPSGAGGAGTGAAFASALLR